MKITKQRHWKRYLLTIGLSLSLLCIVGVLGRSLLRQVNDRLLPPMCYDRDLNRLAGISVTSMRTYRDLVGQTQVVALNANKDDICRFTASSYSTGFWPVTSANARYVAFTSNQFLTRDKWLEYLYVVDSTDGSYVKFSPNDPEEHFFTLSWSPDSTRLAYVSTKGPAGYWQTTYLNLVTPQIQSLWRFDLGTENNRYFGELEWQDNGQILRYGHDEELATGKPMPPPFWCSITIAGRELQCIEK